MNTALSDSPFAVHAQLLLEKDHHVARQLALCVLSLYDGQHWKCRLDCIARFDVKHLQILLDLLLGYYRYGENDPHFLELGRRLQTRFSSQLQSVEQQHS